MTFGLTVIAWIFFRAENVGRALRYIRGICSKSLFSIPSVLPITLFVLLVIFLMIEWRGREEQYAIARLGHRYPKGLRLTMYYAMVLAIVVFSGKEEQFIYFQF